MQVITTFVLCSEFHSGVYVEKIGQIMFAAYLVSVIIVLVNILIAMMSNTFEEIQVRSPSFQPPPTVLW